MPSIGWVELLTIGVVAIVVVGPRELPGLLRQIGNIMGFARRQVRDLQVSIEELGNDLDLEETRKAVQEIRQMRNMNLAEARKKFLEDPDSFQAKDLVSPAPGSAASASGPADETRSAPTPAPTVATKPITRQTKPKAAKQKADKTPADVDHD